MSEAIFTEDFYHDGRGPTLVNVIWSFDGRILKGFEYFNPDDEQSEDNIKHLALNEVEAYMMASEDVHGKNIANGDTVAAIHRITNSDWKNGFLPFHLNGCNHFQIMFYDEIFDVICKSITPGLGRLKIDNA